MTSDRWSQWLLRTRFGGDGEAARRGLAQISLVRDRVLKNASLQRGETLLDLGCGDGLIAFGALDRVGREGSVIFSDISLPLLQRCRDIAASEEAQPHMAFLKASADAVPVRDASIDVVTTRSVLIYVRNKAGAFREMHRVLRAGGRASLFEPINRFNETYDRGGGWGSDIPAVADLAAHLREYFRALQPLASDPMMDFDQHDLVRFAEDAGFHNVHLEYHVLAIPAPAASWDTVVNSPGNPNIPSLAQAMTEVFSDDERALFETHVRPRVEGGGRITRSAVAYLTARKEGP